MKRRALLAVIILIGLFTSPRALGAGEQARPIQATVARAVDGDTIEAIMQDGARIKVRLIGVDCPELTHEDARVRDYASAAAAFTRTQLEGREVWLETDLAMFDIYGRRLAYVWTAPPVGFSEDEMRDCMFNAILLLEGYALTYTLPPNAKYVSAFDRLQHEAIMAARGIWRTVVRWIHIVVYVTNTGKKHHAGGCRYLAESCIPMTLAEAMWRGYGRCKVCKPPYWMSAGISPE